MLAIVAMPAHAADPDAFLSAHLEGSDEVPGPGDPNGVGELFARVKLAKNRLCYELTFKKLDPVEAARIEKGRKGDVSSGFISLFENKSINSPGSREGCRKMPSPFLKHLINHPKRFHVNLRTGAYPLGAVRGQLGEAF